MTPQEHITETQGAAFFKALAHGAVFKWLELIQADASQERLDLQGDLAAILKTAAKVVEKIEQIESTKGDTGDA